MISKILLIIALAVGLKIIYNLYYFLLAKKYYKNYIAYVKGSKSWFVKENRQKIINLLNKAGIKDSHQPTVEPTGYGMIATGSVSVFQNLIVLREDFVTIINGDFREAIGIYKQRIWETFNPFYWAETFFQLPKVIFEYLGIKPGNIIIKIFQLLWWSVVAISTLVGILFNKEFISWFKQI